jgi:NAD-dependent DNA ligase
MIRGIGPAYAKKLLRAFGEKVFDVIEATPDRLREVDGIGPVRAASILAASGGKPETFRLIRVMFLRKSAGQDIRTRFADVVHGRQRRPVYLLR